jgi:hypothetical protein
VSRCHVRLLLLQGLRHRRPMLGLGGSTGTLPVAVMMDGNFLAADHECARMFPPRCGVDGAAARRKSSS